MPWAYLTRSSEGIDILVECFEALVPTETMAEIEFPVSDARARKLDLISSMTFVGMGMFAQKLTSIYVCGCNITDA